MADKTDGGTDGATGGGNLRRGVPETATHRGAAALLGRFGDAPDRLQYAAAAAGAALAVVVAWSTWASPGYGAAVAVLVGLVVFAASLVAVNLGYAAGA